MEQPRKIVPPVWFVLSLASAVLLHYLVPIARIVPEPWSYSGALWIPIAVFIWIIQARFIAGEERFLEEIFGERYRVYRQHVRRWL
jgi:protein-S-isoprenylcysteine O-methyltransferase Ste14